MNPVHLHLELRESQYLQRCEGHVSVGQKVLNAKYKAAEICLVRLEVQMLKFDEPGKHWEELPRKVGMGVVMRNTPTSGRNDDCGWEAVDVVLLLGALVVAKIALAS